MNVCIPVNDDLGLQSEVCLHFGAAPVFLIVDSETRACRAIVNVNQHHGHGGCAPLQSLQGEAIDCMVVGGIGMGALNKLMAAGIQVYRAEHGSVVETIDALAASQLGAMRPEMSCAGHGGH